MTTSPTQGKIRDPWWPLDKDTYRRQELRTAIYLLGLSDTVVNSVASEVAGEPVLGLIHSTTPQLTEVLRRLSSTHGPSGLARWLS